MSNLMLAQATIPNVRARRALQRLNIRRLKGNAIATASQKPRESNSPYGTAPSGTSTFNVPSTSLLEHNPYAELSDDELYEKFRKDGPVLADHSDNTKAAKKSEEAKWIMFCQRRKKDADEELKKGDAAMFKVYLVSRVKWSRIAKQSSIMAYWKTLSMVYAEKVKAWMSDGILYDICNWIRTDLTPKFCLDTSQIEKAGLYIEDLALMLNQLWIRDQGTFEHERLRTQLASNLILAGATATRPGALIGAMLYEHWEFQVFPPMQGSTRVRLVLVVNLEHIKRVAGDSEPKKFAFREDDMLLYDPLIPALALAFSDGAFLNCFLRPRPFTISKCRRITTDFASSTPYGPSISDTKALSYSKERKHLIRLGCSTGFEKQLQWYDLRRGSGKKINEEVTPEERNKIMGHRKGDSSTYLTYYMSNFIDRDCQSICFGSAQQQDLIHLAARLQRHDAAPTCLTDEQLVEINEDEDLKALRAAKANAVQAWKALGYRSRELLRYLKGIRLRQVVQEFHTNVHVEEIDRQLQGIKPADIIAPPSIEYDLPERAHVAQSYAAATKVTDADQLHELRLELVLMGTVGREECGSATKTRQTAYQRAMTQDSSARFAVGKDIMGMPTARKLGR
ncbi:hypothetical protein NQ176_g645 [Zarea fungicola]|uniref:Uncharacterized protein n=1 Tax=Zarea fungicola TaxID=93591 RepID=A0ACC1NVX8_9HYPO|nr:hypothetical protein NQ176_g645 [Lecanicillium fungicola]